LTHTKIETELAGRTLTLETGKWAKLADGAVVARYGDTMVLATAQSGPEREDIDFFPLVVDYREKMAPRASSRAASSSAKVGRRRARR
jgi:polyribonucleotide nucleotidyltransferase